MAWRFQQAIEENLKDYCRIDLGIYRGITEGRNTQTGRMHVESVCRKTVSRRCSMMFGWALRRCFTRVLSIVVHQRESEGVGLGHPHIRTYDVDKRIWSEPAQIGNVERYDHHFAPILLFDPAERVHVLFDCHGRSGGQHIVAVLPKSTDDWKSAPAVDHSVSYPRVFPLPDGRHLMYSRTFGHQGYWTHRITEDGNTWSKSEPLIDFNQASRVDGDTWGGTVDTAHTARCGSVQGLGFESADDESYVRSNSSFNADSFSLHS